MSENNGPVPEHVPLLPRTKSDDFTQPMMMIDHRISRQDGPPDFEEETATVPDGYVIDTVVWDVEESVPIRYTYTNKIRSAI